VYRIPEDLDLSPVVGVVATQVRVGAYDLQFTFGPVDFAVQSPVSLFREGRRIARWEGGEWPESGFYDVMNSEVRRCEVASDRLIVFEFANGLEMHLEDDSDQHECMQITFAGDSTPVIV